MTTETDPTGATTTITETRTLRSTVLDGVLRLSGEGFDGSTLEVEPGTTVVVRIVDADGHYLYANQIPPGGDRAAVWGRNEERGVARRKFEAVSTELFNVVFAVDARDASKVAFGPVIKIKPKGG